MGEGSTTNPPQSPESGVADPCSTCGESLDEHTHDTAIECAMKAPVLVDPHPDSVAHGMYDAADWMRSMRVRSRTGTTDVSASASSIQHMPDPYEAAKRPPAPESKVVDLMAALEQSVKEAREARDVRG